jgi:CheY-like chemotaxis protein
MMAHILVVDDSAFARATLKRKLTESGHVVGEAASGVEALEMLATQHFDLVTMDLLMPEMEGTAILNMPR